MPVSVSNQAYVFLWSIGSGIAVAFLYDLFRIRRKTVKSHDLLVYVEDILYWIIVAVIMFLTIYISNEGEIRGFLFIGALIGVALYIVLLSKIIMTAFLAVLKGLGKAIYIIYSILIYPFKITAGILSYPLKYFSSLVKKVWKAIKIKTKAGLVKAAIYRKTFKNSRKKLKKKQELMF